MEAKTTEQNDKTRASSHFPDRGKPTPSYASCLALSSREGRNTVTQPTSVRRLVLISLVRQPLPRWSSITVFIVFSFVNTIFSVLRDPHLRGTQGTNLQLLGSCFKSCSKVMLPMFTNFVTLPFLSCFLQSKSRSTFVVLVAKALVAIVLVMYFFQSTCPGTLFSSTSLSILRSKSRTDFRIFVAKALVVKYVRVFAFEVFAKTLLMYRIKVLSFKSLSSSHQAFQSTWQKMFDAALRFLGVDR